MQETGTLVLSTPEDRVRRPHSVGRVVLYSEVRIVDEQGSAVATGQTGEVLGRSPAAVTSYYENPARSAETFRNGWIHTGDLGSLDEEGFLTLRGRKKDMIITGGQNVFAAEVEEALLACPGVVDCAVIGLPDPLWGERVSAVVVVRAGAAPTEERITGHCRKTLAGFKIPRQLILQEAPLPRTPTGKVQKFILVERHGNPAKPKAEQ
jgi:fatty-acyl-CoA synthase